MARLTVPAAAPDSAWTEADISMATASSWKLAVVLAREVKDTGDGVGDRVVADVKAEGVGEGVAVPDVETVGEGVVEMVGEAVVEIVGEGVAEMVGEGVSDMVGEEVVEMVGVGVVEMVGEGVVVGEGLRRLGDVQLISVMVIFAGSGESHKYPNKWLDPAGMPTGPW